MNKPLSDKNHVGAGLRWAEAIAKETIDANRRAPDAASTAPAEKLPHQEPVGYVKDHFPDTDKAYRTVIWADRTFAMDVPNGAALYGRARTKKREKFQRKSQVYEGTEQWLMNCHHCHNHGAKSTNAHTGYRSFSTTPPTTCGPTEKHAASLLEPALLIQAMRQHQPL